MEKSDGISEERRKRRNPNLPFLAASLSAFLTLAYASTSFAGFEAIITSESNGDMLLKWPTRQGGTYIVERSSDLQNWDDIGFEIYGQVDSDPTDPSTFTALIVYTKPPPPQGGNPPATPPAEPSSNFFITRG